MPVLSENSPIIFQDKLPEAADVVIIGGGNWLRLLSETIG